MRDRNIGELLLIMLSAAVITLVLYGLTTHAEVTVHMKPPEGNEVKDRVVAPIGYITEPDGSHTAIVTACGTIITVNATKYDIYHNKPMIQKALWDAINKACGEQK